MKQQKQIKRVMPRFMSKREYEAMRRKIKKEIELNEELNKIMAQLLYGGY